MGFDSFPQNNKKPENSTVSGPGREKSIQEVFALNPGLANVAQEATLYKEKELRNAYAQEIISYVWKRLAQEGTTNADNLIGTRKTIENEDFEKFWENVKTEDVDALIEHYKKTKEHGLDEFKKFGEGGFNPATGNFTSGDTSFTDKKIADLEKIQGLKNESIKLYEEYLKTIFPESKVQDIVWHGTPAKEKIEDFNFTKSNYAQAIFFTSDKKFAESFAFDDVRNGSVQAQTLDIRNLFDFSDTQAVNELRPILEELIKENYKSPTGVTFYNNLPSITIGEKVIENPNAGDMVNHFLWRIQNGAWRIIETPRIVEHIAKKYDSIRINEKGTQNIVVFEPEQIHILGSKRDIEKLKEFVSSTKV